MGLASLIILQNTFSECCGTVEMELRISHRSQFARLCSILRRHGLFLSYHNYSRGTRVNLPYLEGRTSLLDHSRQRKRQVWKPATGYDSVSVHVPYHVQGFSNRVISDIIGALNRFKGQLQDSKPLVDHATESRHSLGCRTEQCVPGEERKQWDQPNRPNWMLKATR